MLTIDRIKKACMPPGSHINPADMEYLGVGNIRRAAKLYNRYKHGHIHRWRVRRYRDQFDELMREHGAPATRPNVMRDGWALDTSRTLPHIDRVLEDAEKYIRLHQNSRQGVPTREFIRDIFRWEDLERYPSFLDFILSPDVLTTVSRYLGYIPVLSNTIPPGVRFVESSNDGKPVGGPYRNSQFYHLDLHDCPLVYVILLLRDVTAESGPFTFLSESASDRAVRGLRYLKRKSPYRVTDEEMYKVVDPAEARPMIYPAGTVLFVDSSRCFHYGSRDAVTTRYQMMYAFVSACRTDFTESFMPLRQYPIHGNDSRLRKMVLNKYYTE